MTSSRVARNADRRARTALADIDLDTFLAIDRALYDISGDANRCVLAVGSGDCPFHREYTTNTVLADVNIWKPRDGVEVIE